jgi:superfamily I DNA/RNA helicase
VTLATIHGYKGEEADHVVVATELTERTQWNYLRARDTEHRIFYVAATRARKTLLWARTERTWHYEL